jgi:hypothetical protein
MIVLLAKPYLNDHRGFFVGAVMLLWMLALMGALQSGLITTSRTDTAATWSYESGDAQPHEDTNVQFDGTDQVTELVIQSTRRRHAAKPAVVRAALVERSAPPTYSVWFESERNLGVCRIKWAGGSTTANLHVTARLPEGTHSFWYECGRHRGRGSIDIQPQKVNGVLFCKHLGRVKVETVRSKKGRCGRR